MLAIGLDVHQKRTAVAILDTGTGEMRDRKLSTERVVEHLQQLGGEKRVVLESGGMSVFFAQQLLSLDIDTIVVDAFKAHRRAEAEHTAKTDKLDARTLARLAAEGVGNMAVWVPDKFVDDLRAITRARRQLVCIGTMLRNQIRSIIRREGQTCCFTNLTGKKAQAWLDKFATQLSPGKRCGLQHSRELLADNVTHIVALSHELWELCADCEPVQRLCTICGCGLLLAASIFAEIGDVMRFADASHLRGYSGLVPSTSQSGDKTHTGPLTRKGNRFLRHALVLLAQHVACSKHLKDTPLKRFYGRHLHRFGPNPAKVALARKLCDIIFAMLRDGTAFDPLYGVT
jgi:transposase